MLFKKLTRLFRVELTNSSIILTEYTASNKLIGTVQDQFRTYEKAYRVMTKFSSLYTKSHIPDPVPLFDHCKLTDLNLLRVVNETVAEVNLEETGLKPQVMMMILETNMNNSSTMYKVHGLTLRIKYNLEEREMKSLSFWATNFYPIQVELYQLLMKLIPTKTTLITKRNLSLVLS